MVTKPFIADLHIHSKYSRATARNLDLENIYIWAQRKGITVVGTGDFTHPEWFDQLKEKLEPAEPGLYRLKPDIASRCDEEVQTSCRGIVRFMLTCEISNIYKREGHTRKNHNLVFFSEMADVEKFNSRLEEIGNIRSDGRPILGLDARNLLEIVLETSDEGYLVPAHIWTPWFSMLGSKSGFDSIEACFSDLRSHVFAAETGLSSDPAMNWRVSDLDGLTLISNSDAHSPSKLGREANRFTTSLDYHAMRSALETGDGFAGTFEFYPEEGKYHVDGHRKCEIAFTPAQTRSHKGICPVCQRPLTLGVLHRVVDLSTRPEGVRPKRSFPFHRLIPLDDLLSEILRVGVQSKKVKQNYQILLEKLGSEFSILHDLEKEIIETAGIPLLAEAIERMRDNRVNFSPGFDGQYGTVRIFSEQERKQLLGQRMLFANFEKQCDSSKAEKEKIPCSTGAFSSCSIPRENRIENTHSFGLNADQQQAVDHDKGSLMIVAGPGTGKTRTLTHKIARCIQDGTDAEKILAVTFTNKAATEMKERLTDLISRDIPVPFVGTFHGLGYEILRSCSDDAPPVIVDERMRKDLVRDAIVLGGISNSTANKEIKDILARIALAKQRMKASDDQLDGICPSDRLDVFSKCYQIYEHLLRFQGLVDFEDLIFRTVKSLQTDPKARRKYIGRYEYLFVDEYQDINAGQYRLVRLLAGDHAKVCIIGDPDQAIYGFRGSDVKCFSWFMNDFPDARPIYLKRNYRSTTTILDISTQVIQRNPEIQAIGGRKQIFSDVAGNRTIQFISAVSEKAEAVAIGKTIETMMGGTSFFSMDTEAVDSTNKTPAFGFSDFAVLCRTRRQGHCLMDVLEKAGIPCQMVDRNGVLDHPGIQAVLSLFRLICLEPLFADLHHVSEIFKPSLSKPTIEIVKNWSYTNDLSCSMALEQARRLPIPDLGRSRQKQLYEITRKLNECRENFKESTIDAVLGWILDRMRNGRKMEGDRSFEKGRAHVMDTARSHGTDGNGFMSAVALTGDTDVYDHRAEKVALITMHAAKGLEFPAVFICGCEEGWIPYESHTLPVNEDEERRLFYVALTRAKRHLFLTKADKRKINGSLLSRKWSPFAKDIENRYKSFSGSTSKKTEKPTQTQLSLF